MSCYLFLWLLVYYFFKFRPKRSYLRWLLRDSLWLNTHIFLAGKNFAMIGSKMLFISTIYGINFFSVVFCVLLGFTSSRTSLNLRYLWTLRGCFDDKIVLGPKVLLSIQFMFNQQLSFYRFWWNFSHIQISLNSSSFRVCCGMAKFCWVDFFIFHIFVCLF